MIRAEYIDHMGDDLRVVNAARVSFNKESSEFSANDERLVNYLARNNHFTPFTHCVVTLRETVPIFVARQRFKHTVGFTYNEVSRRYVDDKPEFYIPDEWREKSDEKKQGSGEDFPEDKQLWLKRDYSWLISELEKWYSHLLAANVAPEQARMVLPQSMLTSYYVTGSLHAFARAYKLRSDTHAQKEIQGLASQWDEIIRPLYPFSWSALVD